MLRLPRFTLHEPQTLEEATTLLAEYGPGAMVVAGGTDLLPNMKHRLFEPAVVVSLARIEELQGVRGSDDGGLEIGAMARIDEVAGSPLVQQRAPALAQATSLIAGPQLRSMGTLGGNVMLDTRCQWYNQTYFWRQALGFCMKKDGTVCHVVEGGRKCVAAASNDSAAVLMTLGAALRFESAEGSRSVPLDELWQADGIQNKKVEQGEILTRIHIPPVPAGHRGAYGKLRDRGSIDYPLLGIAVRLDLDEDERIAHADLAAVALAARPLRLKKAAGALVGVDTRGPELEQALTLAAEAAHKQCKPLPNIPGDHEYRREMVSVYTLRTLRAALDGSGPVHHV